MISLVGWPILLHYISYPGLSSPDVSAFCHRYVVYNAAEVECQHSYTNTALKLYMSQCSRAHTFLCSVIVTVSNLALGLVQYCVNPRHLSFLATHWRRMRLVAFLPYAGLQRHMHIALKVLKCTRDHTCDHDLMVRTKMFPNWIQTHCAVGLYRFPCMLHCDSVSNGSCSCTNLMARG